MYKVKAVKSEYIFKVAREILSHGKNVKITVTGDSMYPFLRQNIDSVVLCFKSFSEVRKGDIVLIIRENKEYVLHRVFKKTRSQFYIVGDAQQNIEGPLNSQQLVAVVNSVYREDKQIFCTNTCWKLLSSLWLLLLPFRYFFINNYIKLRRLI